MPLWYAEIPEGWIITTYFSTTAPLQWKTFCWQHMDLGAVWCGIVNELVNFFRQQLSLPEEVLPVALVAVGHPAEERPVPERYDPSHVHFEAYQSKN